MPTNRHVVALLMAAGVLSLGGTGGARAHDGIESSDPASGSTITEPIDVARFDFGAVIGDDTELALIDPNDEELPSTTVVTGPTTAEIRFDPLDEHGTYLIRYLAPVADDGHLVVGAVSFTYGSQPGQSVLPWIAFGIAAVLILAIGAVFSRRAGRRAQTDSDTAAANTDDVPGRPADSPIT